MEESIQGGETVATCSPCTEAYGDGKSKVIASRALKKDELIKHEFGQPAQAWRSANTLHARLATAGLTKQDKASPSYQAIVQAWKRDFEAEKEKALADGYLSSHQKAVAQLAARRASNAQASSSARQGTIESLLEQAEQRAFTRKKPQLQAVYHVMRCGRPMVEYESLGEMLRGLDCEWRGGALTADHWSDDSGWGMAVALSEVRPASTAGGVHAQECILQRVLNP